MSIGWGTHILPKPGGDCIIVGGDISTDRTIQVSKDCDIVHRGTLTNTIRHNPNYDITLYEKMNYVLANKSQFWKTLPSTGDVNSQWGTTTYQCSNNDDVQVFNILSNELYKSSNTDSIEFSDSCEGKTVLINVHGTGNIGVNAAVAFFKHQTGPGEDGFSSCMTESILRNFPDAASVDIGNGKRLNTMGRSWLQETGRTIVLGNMLHDSTESELHSYQFAPPMPLPDPEDV